MRLLLDFDDAGASDDEPVKGVTVGDIRAWHDQYDKMLTSWAECRELLSKERAITVALVRSLREIEFYSSDLAMTNAARAAVDAAILATPISCPPRAKP